MYNDFAKNQGLNKGSFPPEKKMGSHAESLEKKNIFLKKGDEIRRLDGRYCTYCFADFQEGQNF